MNVVDSSGWLEYVAGSPQAAFFAPAIERTTELVVPAITLYEVFKRITQQVSESAALTVVAHMRQGHVVEVNASLALEAARLSIAHGLPMADSLILATAQAFKATLWTQDAHFEGLPNVQFLRKTR